MLNNIENDNSDVYLSPKLMEVFNDFRQFNILNNPFAGFSSKLNTLKVVTSKNNV